MKIVGSSVQKTFIVEHNDKSFFVNYLNSDYPNLSLINRDNWEICDEDSEELEIYTFRGETKEKLKEIKKNRILAMKLIKFCINYFDDWNPIKNELEAEAKKGEIKLKKR